METAPSQEPRKPLHRGRIFGILALLSALLIIASEWVGRLLSGEAGGD